MTSTCGCYGIILHTCTLNLDWCKSRSVYLCSIVDFLQKVPPSTPQERVKTHQLKGDRAFASTCLNICLICLNILPHLPHLPQLAPFSWRTQEAQKMTSTSLPTSTKLNDRRNNPWSSIESLYIDDKNGFRADISKVTGNNIPAFLTKWKILPARRHQVNKRTKRGETTPAEKREWKTYTQFFTRFVGSLHKNHGLPKISEGKYSIVLLLH